MTQHATRDGIRRFQLDDLSRLREICVLTGAAGGDATGRWSTDDLLPDLFLEPYLTYAPDWAWVVDLGDGPVGYLVAVPDTRRFVAWWRAKWAPAPRPRAMWVATTPPCQVLSASWYLRFRSPPVSHSFAR